MSVEVTVSCKHCGAEANSAFCQKHLDSLLAEAYEEGKSEGENEGYKRGFIEAELQFRV